MSLPLLLVAVAAGSVQDPVQAHDRFLKPQNVVESNRLAITPKLDGVLSPEEWDPFSTSDGVETFLQWEPRKIHVAAKMPEGHDLVLSLDMKSNGWLVGQDNLEVRVRMQDGQPVVSSRVLDAKAVTAPTWERADGFAMASKVAAKSEAGVTVIELTVEDPNVGMLPQDPGNTMIARVDALPSNSPEPEGYLPRIGAPVKVVMERASAMPVGLNWKPEISGRVVLPGDSTRMRVTFNGKGEFGLKRLELRSEGFLQETTNTKTVPFPAFDNKNRAFVDYDTKIKKEEMEGYRVLRGTLELQDGPPAIVQTSYWIAPILNFDLQRPEIKEKASAQQVRFSFFIRSNSPRRLDGVYNLTMPQGWELKTGEEKSFVIYNSRGSVRRVFDVVIPANTKGTFPVRFSARMGNRMEEQVGWVTIP